MFQRNIYSNFLKTTALVFSFCAIAAQSQAMEAEDYREGWWGMCIIGHSALNVPTQGDLFTLNAPSATGISGRIAVPALSIHVPKEGEPSFLTLLNAKPPLFEVDTLYINGRRVDCPNPFRGGEFKAYELTVNGQNLGQALNLYAPLKAPKDEYLQHFANVVQLLEPQVQCMNKSSKDSDYHSRARLLQNPIKSHLNTRKSELILSRMRCTSPEDHSGQHNGPDKLDLLRNNFTNGFLPLFNEFNAPQKTYRKIKHKVFSLSGYTSSNLWVSDKWREEDYNLYINHPQLASHQIKNFDQMLNQVVLLMDESNGECSTFDLALGIGSLRSLVGHDESSKHYWLELFEK